MSETENTISELAKNALSNVALPEKLAIACAKVRNLYAAFDVKKYAVISSGRKVFTFSGWLNSEDANALEAEIESDNMVMLTRHAGYAASPPTLLKNLPVIKQFEFFTKLYGLPEYGEVDPTPILAITYTLLFGLMFGDIGHGAVLAVFGILVQRRWHTNLGGIMQVVGVSAALFGILYGSVFGFEFNPVWRRPTTNINETLIFAAALGAGLIALSMLFNMYNSLKRGKIAELLFSANGVAGLLFYSAALWLVVRVVFQGRDVTPLVIIVAVLPLAFICLKHPLENFLNGNKLIPRTGKGQLLGGMAIELFETLLTYATNTISFVRVGAFAVSHVGMMHVVLQLSQNAAGAGNILILIFGNIIVMVIEGLLVGIQVLRLDFYEMFSRFYKGTGTPFKSSKI
jgi:V/A-type H+-transporting ATPase subunit I